MRPKTALTAAAVVASNVLGNFCLSLGLKQAAPLTASPLSYLSAFLSPWVVLGVALLILWMLTRVALLSWADLSFVLPVTAAGYVLTALMGKMFLAEQIGPARWAGTLLIVAGVALVSVTPPRTTRAARPAAGESAR